MRIILDLDIEEVMDEIANRENDNQDSPCKVYVSDLRQVFRGASIKNLKALALYINKYGGAFGITDNHRLQHFLAQAGHETESFTKLEENLNYRWRRLGTKDYFEGHFNTVDNPTADPKKANPYNFRRKNAKGAYIDSKYVDVEKFANYVYETSNGNKSYGDGYKFRGRGFMHLTGRANYEDFEKFYRKRYDDSVNFRKNPELLTDLKISVISALWYFEKRVIDRIGVDARTSVVAVTKKVNGGRNGLPNRKKLYKKTKATINCK